MEELRLGSFYALMSALGFSSANIMVRKGTSESSKNNGAFISMVITALISGVIFIGIGLSRGWPLLSWEGIFWFCLAGILTTFFGRNLLYTSIQLLGAVRASAIKRLNPFFAVLFGVGLLNEPITLPLMLGLLFIFISFTLLIYENDKKSNRQHNKEVSVDSEAITETHKKKTMKVYNVISKSYIYGIASSVCYALGYVVRKVGLSEINEPFFGTFLGAGVGVLVFILMAGFKERYSISVKTSFEKFEFWLILAGVSTSLGQIFYFLALSKIEVSRVALIASVEVVITLILSAIFLKKVESLNGTVILACILSMAGAMILAMG